MVIEANVAAATSGITLEIGGGVNQVFRRAIWRKGAGHQWVGIDGNWDDRPLKSRYKGLVSRIPFGDEAFDSVVAFHSMEHWESFGDPIQDGLSEILRVLKPGGFFAASVPIHSHGDKVFIVGDLASIRGLFSDARWKEVKFEEWRRDHDPLPPDPPDEREIAELRKSIPRPTPITQWMLEIRATKV